MADSGDGWIDCTCSDRRHWGIHGAAGLLLVSDGWVLLAQRSPGSHHGGTWSIPGGAMRRGETAEEGAVREAVEEVGLDPARIELVGAHVDDHGDWSFTTVIATHQGAGSMRPVAETAAVEWVHAGLVARYNLLPAFREAWEGELEQRVQALGLTTRQTLTEVPADAPLTGWRAWSSLNSDGALQAWAGGGRGRHHRGGLTGRQRGVQGLPQAGERQPARHREGVGAGGRRRRIHPAACAPRHTPT